MTRSLLAVALAVLGLAAAQAVPPVPPSPVPSHPTR